MNWLDKVKAITLGPRLKSYGHPLVNMCRVAQFWTTYLRRKLLPGAYITVLDAIMLMDLLKTAREMNAYDEDNFIDKLGYISLIDRIDQKCKELGYGGASDLETLSEQEALLLYQKLETVFVPQRSTAAGAASGAAGGISNLGEAAQQDQSGVDPYRATDREGSMEATWQS